VSTLVGGAAGTSSTYSDGYGSNAGFSFPEAIAVDLQGNVFVADRINQRVRKVTAGAGTRASCVGFIM
jgi:hypothetical protein